ncbi:MAG TPA: hypothetical protein VFV19_16960 [Candidatus Polarisedimenticolaceae bacterium]|nr:hypothetical protein [Candidatus Polarisedimenticolaceae bacterium]
MRVSRLVAYVSVIGLISCLVAVPVGAATRHSKSKPSKVDAKRKLLSGTAPAAPDTNDTPKASMPYAKTDTVHAFTNAMGQTVYEVSASQSDVSRPLTELAAERRPFFNENEEFEAPANPILPAFRIYKSGVPDPVVQQVQPQIETSGGPSPAAPSTGFNFQGIGIAGGTPSDSNGSVGTTQFVETVNTRYQVWTLNRSTHAATSVLGPININTLWSGFGGACETQNSGDPIVLFDKLANRWLISQFTTTLSNGSYFQCVAVSKTNDATGQFNRFAFTVPNGVFGDYPHFGVWSDAYYMMAHGFTSTSGSYVAGIFAAMDRTKMINGDPTATWQVIFDPAEGGHMPADIDGFAPPPQGAPGIFLSLHESSMVFYRMSVDFVNPANTVRTEQADVPVAPYSAACGGGTCIPQPSTTQLVGSLADRLMFRAAYRKYVDHESIVISHSVDPGVSGLVSGVRWYDFRMSGVPDATCPSFPCVRQQGTIADVAGGRSRWMPSIAMDTAENIIVGYSTTGKTAGTDNQSIRYTGRAKNDSPGVMPGPEQIIVTGTANNTNTRWGDYSSMSVDPADDCTLFYTNQFYASAGAWSTRIASASYPGGVSPGQCPATVCSTRPAAAPTIGTATVPGDNKIQVTWTPLVPAPGSYAIERADGVCGSGALFKPLAGVSGAASSFTDTTVLGGLSYSYRVIAATDGAAKCQSLVTSGCVSATATGTCNLKPSFAGASAASSVNQSTCGVTVNWSPAATACPLTPNMKYDVFRGTTPDFVPSAANRIATCVNGPTSYLDTNNLQSGTTYFYVVRAEDNSTGNGGDCSGGNEEANSVTVAGTAYGVGTQSSPGTWFDGGGDGSAFLQMNVGGPGDVAGQVWRYVKTANDPGANHTPGGSYAYRNAGPGPTATYLPNQCAEIQAPALTAGATSLALQYWERHQLEYHWDGIAVEYSVNGGDWLDVPPPSNSPAAGCDPADTITGWETLGCTGAPPVNGCAYDQTKSVIDGPLGSGSTCNDFATSSSVPAYAHRCHPITGLNVGDSIQFRWRFTSDPAAEFAGFYLDDVAVTNVNLPNACVPDTCTGQPDGTSCSDGNSCTTGDACSGGVCHPGTSAPTPVEVTGVAVNDTPGTTLSWPDVGGGAVYDVASQTLSDLRVNGTATATCLQNDVAVTSFSDPRPDPVPGDGYYYLVRAQTVCATGTYGFASGSVERIPTSACP